MFALQENWVSTNKSIGTSPFQLVYGSNVIFPASLGAPVTQFLQEQDTKSNPIQSRINQLVEVHQIKDQVVYKARIFQDKVKRSFDRKANPNDFQQGDLVLKWDARHEHKGKHGKFKHLQKGPYHIAKDRGNNSYILQEANGDSFLGRLVNGQVLKHYLTS